jgi:hypothetical protein
MRRAFTALLLVLLAVAWTAVASATTSSVRSTPNGDIGVIVSVGCGATDRDRDGDFNTCTKGDTASLFFAVDNLSDVTQTVRIEHVLDGPGTEFDRVVTQELVLGGGHQERDELRIQTKKVPVGQFTLTITASGLERPQASANFTVH